MSFARRAFNSRIAHFVYQGKAPFVVFIVFVSIMSVAAYLTISQMQHNLEVVSVEKFHKQRLMEQQLRALLQRELLLQKILNSDDPFEQDELALEHSGLATEFIVARQQLLELSLSAEERDMLEGQTRMMERAYPLQLEIIETLIQGGEVADIQSKLEEIEPLLKTVYKRVDLQRQRVIELSNTALQQARDHHHYGWLVMMLSYAVTLVFSGALMIWVYRRQKDYQINLHYQATHDQLTELVNRPEFEYHLEVALQETVAGKVSHVVLFLDLDRFKHVNDTAGHLAGDSLLKELSSELTKHARDADLIARLGGDEFGVLLRGCNLDKGSEIAEKLRGVISGHRFVWEDRIFTVGVSIGLLVMDGGIDNMTDLLTAVDKACYAAKAQGRNRVHEYTQQTPTVLAG